jgi:chromate reductase
MKILTLSGSLRKGSYNTTLCRAVAELAPEGVEVVHHDLRPIPFYDEDLERPDTVQALIDAVEAADGVVIATPEYTYSIPGVLKNALDWASRPGYNGCFKHKPVAMISASPSGIGGARAQQTLRNILGAHLAHVFPFPEFTVMAAHEKIDDGKLTDADSRDRLAELLEGFVAFTRQLG